MKRIISIALVLIVMAALLAGCGDGNPVGKYVVKSVNGQDINGYIESMGVPLDLLNIEKAEDFMTIDIREGGKFVTSMMGDESDEGTWKMEGGKLIMTIDGDAQEATLKGNEITMTAGSEEIVFIKK